VRAETSAPFIWNQPDVTLHDAQTKLVITQTNIPLPPADTVVASPSPPATHGSTGVEQAPKLLRLTSAIHELGNFLCLNFSDASESSRPNAPSLEGAFGYAQPGPSRELVRSPQPDPTVTSPSNIGMSLEAVTSGFHHMFRGI